jgi:hypothetical protein
MGLGYLDPVEPDPIASLSSIEGEFEGCEVTHIGRESNEEADNLANILLPLFQSLACICSRAAGDQELSIRLGTARIQS